MIYRVLFIVSAFSAFSTAHAEPYQFQDITPPGASSVSNIMLNDLREVASFSSNGRFIWRANPVHGLPAGFMNFESVEHPWFSPQSINNRGQVVGTYSKDDWLGIGLYLPEADYGMPSGLNKLARGGYGSHINNNGEIVVSLDYDSHLIWLPQPAYGRTSGFHYTGVGAGGLASMGGVSSLNDNGLITGRVDSDYLAVYLMQPQAGYTGAGIVHLANASISGTTLAANNKNQLLVSYKEGNGPQRYAFWMPVDEGEFSAGEYPIGLGATSVSLNALNDRGQVTGVIDGTPFLWDRASGLYNLRDLAVFPSQASDVVPVDINENGDITGCFTIGTARHGFVLFIPEPAACAEVAFSVLILRRRNCRKVMPAYSTNRLA